MLRRVGTFSLGCITLFERFYPYGHWRVVLDSQQYLCVVELLFIELHLLRGQGGKVILTQTADKERAEHTAVAARHTAVELVGLQHQYNINLNTTSFKQRRKVWSDRLHIAAQKSPCILNPEIEAQIKTDIADIVVKLGMSAIADYDKQYVESIVDAIETFAG